MRRDPLAGWLRFLASPAAPATALRPLELEGFLTGIIVTPDLIPPSRWLSALWGDGVEPVFNGAGQLQAVLDSVMGFHNGIIEALDAQGAAWRPMFMDADGVADLGKADVWVHGFWRAMRLAPAAWSALAEDERTRILVEPFAAFIDTGISDDIPPPSDEDRKDSAALIPRVFPALRKLARMRAAAQPSRTSRKPGRNEPCPCGSGKKYKHCCGRN